MRKWNDDDLFKFKRTDASHPFSIINRARRPTPEYMYTTDENQMMKCQKLIWLLFIIMIIIMIMKWSAFKLN